MARKRNPFDLEMPDLSGSMNMNNLFGETPKTKRMVPRVPRPYPQPYPYPRPRVYYAPRQRARYARVGRSSQPRALIGPEQRQKIIAGARMAYAGTKVGYAKAKPFISKGIRTGVSYAKKRISEYQESKRKKWRFERQPSKLYSMRKGKVIVGGQAYEQSGKKVVSKPGFFAKLKEKVVPKKSVYK